MSMNDPAELVESELGPILSIVRDRLVTEQLPMYRTTAVDPVAGEMWSVVFERTDPEIDWEGTLTQEEAVRLLLHKVGHLTDLIDQLGRLEAQTHALLHTLVGHEHGNGE